MLHEIMTTIKYNGYNNLSLFIVISIELKLAYKKAARFSVSIINLSLSIPENVKNLRGYTVTAVLEEPCPKLLLPCCSLFSSASRSATAVELIS